MNLAPLLVDALLLIARQSIEYFFETKQVLPYERVRVNDEQKRLLQQIEPIFVALYTNTDNKHPRGVNGVFESYEPLGKIVGQLAVNAAFYDPHTPRLRPYELNILTIHLLLPGVRCKVLGSLAEIAAIIEKQRQGVIAETQGRIAYVLPFDWTENMTGMQMIRWLKLQLGVSKKVRRPIEYSTFSVTDYSDSV